MISDCPTSCRGDVGITHPRDTWRQSPYRRCHMKVKLQTTVVFQLSISITDVTIQIVFYAPRVHLLQNEESSQKDRTQRGPKRRNITRPVRGPRSRCRRTCSGRGSPSCRRCCSPSGSSSRRCPGANCTTRSCCGTSLT